MRIAQQISDSSLIEGIRKDTPGMFEQLFNLHWEWLYHSAFRRLRDSDEAEDMVQDLFAELWLRRHTLNVSASIKTYLTTALKYKIIKRVAQADLKQKSLDHLLQQMGQVEATVLDLMSAGELHKTLDEAITKFPENMRRIFQMRTADFTIAEIAEALSLSEQTVKNNTSEALRRLRFILSQKHPEIPPSSYLAFLVFLT